MRYLIALLLACAAWAQPVNPPPAVLKGSPPGGIGAACSGTPLLGYLDSSGRVITCVSNLWAVTGGGAPSGSAGGSLSGTYPDPGFAYPMQAKSGSSTAMQAVPSTAAPSAPTVTTHGTAGTTHYGYKIAFSYPQGVSAASAETLITTGNATLNSSNYNVITLPACTGVGESVNIYVSTSGGNVTQTGWLANGACGGTYNHQGANGTGYAPASADQTTGTYAPQLAVGVPPSQLTAYAQATLGILGNQGPFPTSFWQFAKGTNLQGSFLIYDGLSDGITPGELFNGYSFGTVSVPSLYGALGGFYNCYTTGTGAISRGSSCINTFAQYDGSGGMGYLYGLDVGSNFNSGNGTVTNNAGIHVQSQSGVATNNYGVLIDNQGSTNKSIKVGTGIVDLAGATSALLPSATTGTTQSASDNSTKMATTAYVDTADALKANLASPAFSGTPSLPTGTVAVTQSPNDNSTKVATTAYADAAASAGVTAAPPYVTIAGTAYLFLFPVTQPPTSSWTWANQGTSTATTVNNAIHLVVQQNLGVTAIRCYTRALPASTGYTAEIGLMSLNQQTAIAISDGTKYEIIFQSGAGVYWIETWTATTSATIARLATLSGWNTASPNFLRWRDAGGTRFAEASADGTNWTTLRSESTATFLTETRAGFCWEEDHTQDAQVNLVHWKATTP